MIQWNKPYERSEVEYKERTSDLDPRKPTECKHCEEPLGYHWQTADGKIWCVRNTDNGNGERNA